MDRDWPYVTERVRDEVGDSRHRTRAANVAGALTVTVTENDGARTLTFTDADLVVADPPELWPKISAADVIFVPPN